MGNNISLFRRFASRVLGLLLQLKCWLKKRHTPDAKVIVKDGQVYAFYCKQCCKPLGQPIGVYGRNAGTSQRVWGLTNAIIMEDKVKAMHKNFDKLKANA